MARYLLLAVFSFSYACAQWIGYLPPGTPKTRDGKADLSARAPRVGGKPDLSGAWHVEPTSMAEMKKLYGADVDKLDIPGMEADTISKYAVNILLDYNDSILRPEGARILRGRVNGTNPSDRCLPMGVPFAMLVSEPDKIVQTPGLILMLFESSDAHRQIYMDGRPLPKDPFPSWLGYSVGRWEGDTLVVETAGFNDKTWLDAIGHPHSEGLHLTERYTRRDFGHLDVQMTFDDLKLYTKPFTIKFTQRLQPDGDVLEFFCNENEKDRVHGAK
jgi:hypothetical protein